MLVFVKKEEIRPTKAEGKLLVEATSEEKIQAMLGRESEIDLNEISSYYIDRPSIRAEVLAHIIGRTVGGLNEGNLDQSIHLLLSLIALPHDEKELLHFLKNKHKVDAKLLLVALWNFRTEESALHLVKLTLDCYPLHLMLNAKEVVLLWKQYISERIRFEHARIALKTKLSQSIQSASEEEGDGFNRVIIPL